MDFEIREVPTSKAVSAQPSWLFHGAAEVGAASHRLLYGYDDLAYNATDLAARYANQHQTRSVMQAALAVGVEGDPAGVLGIAMVRMPLRDNTHRAHVNVEVHPEVRRRGVGTALWAAAERVVTKAGRGLVVTFTSHAREPRADEAGALGAPTGSGRLPGLDAGARFALGRGFTLAQVERHSVEAVPVAEELLARLGEEAGARAAGEYELVHWIDRAPDALVDGMCALQVAMSSGMPHGELEVHTEMWDAERWRDAEADALSAGRVGSVVAAVHRRSGEVAGYTKVRVMRERPEVGFQEDTIVLRRHRGRRLGLWLKVENLRQLAVGFPDLRRIHTFNAEENSHMLDINEALGFEAAGVDGAWQLRL